LMDMCFSDLLETTNGACGLTKFAIDGFSCYYFSLTWHCPNRKKKGDDRLGYTRWYDGI